MTLDVEAVASELDPAVAALDFSKLKWKLTVAGEDKLLSPEVADFAELEYRRFLTLKKLYPAVELVPSKLIDTFWHAHILDTRSYHDDCQRVFGTYIHHYPYFGIHDADDRHALEDAFEQTKELYERHFGPYPEAVSVAARCKDHACHAPSDCACRVKGSCK